MTLSDPILPPRDLKHRRSLAPIAHLTSIEFTVSPADLAAYTESWILDAALGGGCDGCGDGLRSPAIAGRVGIAGSGGPVPQALLVARASAAVTELYARRGVSARPRGVARIRAQAGPQTFEPLLLWVRTRAYSPWRPDLGYLTAEVIVRRRGGGELLRCELALELQPAAQGAA